MSMRQLLSEHQRISILMALAEAPGFCSKTLIALISYLP